MARVKARARILWHWATETHGVKPATSSDLIPWCVKYSAQLIQLTHVGSDGMTAYRRVTGRREFVRPLVPWGCKVMYIPGGAKSKANLEKWLEGVFVGFTEKTWEYVVLTPVEPVYTRDVKRFNSADERDPALFLGAQDLPWQNDVPHSPLALQMPATGERDLPDVPEPDKRWTRKVYIRADVELKKFGFTDKCPGCNAVKGGKAPQSHNPTCRARIEAAMNADPQLAQRVELAQDRQGIEDAVRAHAQQTPSTQVSLSAPSGAVAPEATNSSGPNG